MEHFVTLFDALFLPQGLALHISMERHVKDYTLWVLCVDDCVHGVLTKLQLPNVRLLQLSKLETEDLLRVKPARSNGEYCWTLTPFAPRFVFEADASVERVTYLDADLWFRKNPKPIFDEFEASGKTVLITDHAYAPEYDQSAMSGQYCVQFMTFQRDASEEVRDWWEKRCIEWCFGRFEEEKFGDQKYLDLWPNIFKNKVHVLINKELCLAPWNASRYPYGNAIIYHFHSLRMTGQSSFHFGYYYIPKVTIDNIYLSYAKDLKQAVSNLKAIGVALRIQKTKSWFPFEFLRMIRLGLQQINLRNTINW